jgi:hypothetical protein
MAVTNFGFNALNQSTSRTLPLGNQESFGYDIRNRQLLQVTFEGIYVRMVYDDSATGGGRLSEVSGEKVSGTVSMDQRQRCRRSNPATNL